MSYHPDIVVLLIIVWYRVVKIVSFVIFGSPRSTLWYPLRTPYFSAGTKMVITPLTMTTF